jgi:hypothetical protein
MDLSSVPLLISIDSPDPGVTQCSIPYTAWEILQARGKADLRGLCQESFAHLSRESGMMPTAARQPSPQSKPLWGCGQQAALPTLSTGRTIWRLSKQTNNPNPSPI